MDSTPNLQQLSASQNNQELRFNEVVDALSPSSYFGRNAQTQTGLTWGYYGAKYNLNGVETSIANGTVTLTASTTNYVQVSQAGVVSVATSRTATLLTLYVVVTGTTAPTSWTDERDPVLMKRFFEGIVTKAMADANQTLTQQEALAETLITTGSNSAQRNLVVPLVRRTWTVFCNNTTNGIQVIGASGTGTVIAVGKTAIVRCDGTNVVRVTADV